MYGSKGNSLRRRFTTGNNMSLNAAGAAAAISSTKAATQQSPTLMVLRSNGIKDEVRFCSLIDRLS